MSRVEAGASLSPSDAASLILDAGLFHQQHYERQRSDRFDTALEAAVDFLEHGAAHGLSPHPLFDVRFYLRSKPALDAAGGNALVHYILIGWLEGRDPHPLFDAEWYVAHAGAPASVNPLTHYLREGTGRHRTPNPLFDDTWYCDEHPDAAGAGLNPLVHYVLYGCSEGRRPGAVLGPLLDGFRRPPREPLTRGSWRRPNPVWMVASGAEEGPDAEVFEHTWRTLTDEAYDVRVVFDRRGALCDRMERAVSFCLEDCGAHTGGARFRASALRMALFALLGAARHVRTATPCAVPDVAAAFADLGVTVSTNAGAAARPSAAKRILVPCMDWSTSGVHTAAHALGEELIARGWDFRILFTRGTLGVFDGGTDRGRLPQVPYEFLDLSQCHTLRQHLSAIIGRFESAAPCVVLATFDDLANAVAPALTDRVGVVGWLQSDEAHYYESAYRLGRYWNRMACVSDRIAATVGTLNPAFAPKIARIANATVRRADVLERNTLLDGGTLRLVYAGRLVHHQKRVLDFVPLVGALERARIAYRLTLIGDAAGDHADHVLARELAAPIARGAVRLTGRLNRAEVLRELSDHDVFLLLSDFEGFPVSVVEAMARGCIPVVAQMQSGIPELIRHGDNGLVIDHRDYDRWAAVLGDLARDERRMQRLSAAATHDVLERHTVDALADRFDALFSSVLDEIVSGSYRRPPALTWRSRVGDILLPPSLQGTAVD